MELALIQKEMIRILLEDSEFFSRKIDAFEEIGIDINYKSEFFSCSRELSNLLLDSFFIPKGDENKVDDFIYSRDSLQVVICTAENIDTIYNELVDARNYWVSLKNK